MLLDVSGFCWILLDVAEGIEFLHKNHIMHLNIAPDNILIFKYEDGSIIPKISSFEHCQRVLRKSTRRVCKDSLFAMLQIII